MSEGPALTSQVFDPGNVNKQKTIFDVVMEVLDAKKKHADACAEWEKAQKNAADAWTKYSLARERLGAFLRAEEDIKQDEILLEVVQAAMERK